MNRKLVLSGKLSYEYCGDSFHKYKLEQEDGFKVDLIGRIVEGVENFQHNSKLDSKVRMYETSEPESFLDFEGKLHVSYDVIPYQLDEYTSGTYYETEFKVGKIDVTQKLNNFIGKNLVIEIEIFEK